jgi:hypothetical protein
LFPNRTTDSPFFATLAVLLFFGGMPPTIWIAAALRILAIWLIAGSVVALPSIVATVSGILWLNESDPLGRLGRWSTIGAAIGILLKFAVGAIIWTRSEQLATRVWSDSRATDAPGVEPAITPDDLQRVAFAAIGLYLLIDLVPSVVRQALEYGSLPDMDRLELPPDMQTRLLANLVAAVVQTVTAIWLLFYPDGLIELIARVRRKVSTAQS